MFTQMGRLQTACLRYFNVFGPRQDPRSAYAAAVPIFTAKAVAGEPLTIYGDGEQTRDFIYVKDIVAANVFMATHDFTGVYNIAYGGRITINDLVKLIKEVTRSQSEVVHLPERAGDVKHSMAAIDKLKATGFVPQFDFDTGMKATVEFFQSQKKQSRQDGII
jgi:UDP-glucose 4-epimerase